jgi:hypothetical protein
MSWPVSNPGRRFNMYSPRTTSSGRKLMLMDAMSEFDAGNRNRRIGERLETSH